jgi:hypothetical protein
MSAVALAACSKPAPSATPPGPPGAASDAGGDAPSVVAGSSPLCEGGCPSTAPMYPTERCADGLHLGGRGPCAHLADGTCNWTRLVCPAAGAPPCGAADCALPVPAVWMCPDGSRGEFTCVRDAGGSCGATYRPCPVTPVVVAPPPPPPPPPPRKAHPCTPLPSDRELLRWPIGEICHNGGGPAQPDRTVIKRLADGTQIIEQLGQCLRVREVECRTKCLAAGARIATPAGDVAVQDVRAGTLVWTQDARGARVAAPVERVVRTPVEGVHHVARVRLSDGRSVVVSPEHPALGALVQELRAGDPYDGATIVALDLVRYGGAATYDLRPAGTGIYWADGIPLRSTISAAEPAGSPRGYRSPASRASVP